jgi:hypothetical protein
MNIAKKILIVTILVCFVFACDDQSTGKIELRLVIKENKINCTGYEGQTECYLVQMDDKIGTEEWEFFYEQIDGFVYESGFRHDLLVVKEKVSNPPIDSPAVRYTLLKQQSKIVK